MFLLLHIYLKAGLKVLVCCYKLICKMRICSQAGKAICRHKNSYFFLQKQNLKVQETGMQKVKK